MSWWDAFGGMAGVTGATGLSPTFDKSAQPGQAGTLGGWQIHNPVDQYGNLTTTPPGVNDRTGSTPYSGTGPVSGTYGQGGGQQGGQLTDQGAPDPQRDPEGYVYELLRRAGYNTPSPEGLAAIEPYLNRNGMSLQRNSAGQIRGRVYIGQGYDNHFDVTGAAGFVPGGGGGFGGGAGGALGGMLGSGDVASDPSFQFRLQEGQKALERSAAAKGTLLTGGTAKALTRYAQDYASTEYGNIFDRLYRTAGLGLNAAGTAAQLGSSYGNQLGSANQNFSNQYGDLTTNQANATAAGNVNASNAWAGTIGDLGNMAGQWFERRRGGGGGRFGASDYEWQGPPYRPMDEVPRPNRDNSGDE